MAKLDEKGAALLRAHEDKRIEQEINRKLAAVMTWDTSEIRMSVTDGMVSLSGTVADTRSLEQSVLIIFTVRGVKKIENKIKIRKEGIVSMTGQPASGIASIDDDNEDRDKQE